jgi:hypothetical protein
MSMSYSDEGQTGLDTARGRDWPSVRQFSVFLQNRVGALMDLVRKFEVANNRIVALSVVDSADCSIVRIVLSDPERAYETLHAAKLPFLESDLLVVQMPSGPHPMGRICKALLAAEINIHYAYSLIVGESQSALALHVDDHETSVITLQKQGFTVCTENDLGD